MVTQGVARVSVSLAISALVGRSMCSTMQFSGKKDGGMSSGWRGSWQLASDFPISSRAGLPKRMQDGLIMRGGELQVA
jgi:hypothetical protein